MNTIKNLRTRMNKRAVALVLTFGLVLTGSGLASLASLSDTLQDTVTFNTLSVDLKDGVADTSAITFSGINPVDGGSFTQTINLTNSGSASATVSVASLVTTGAGSDLDTAIKSAAFDGGSVRVGPGAANRAWVAIDGLGADIGTFTLNASASKLITLHFAVTPNANMVATSLVAQITFTATHP